MVLTATELPTQPFRDEHAALLEHLEHIRRAGAEVAHLDAEERRKVVAQVLGFLRGTLIPHAEAEEEVLYPKWAQLVGYDDAALTMVHDHRAIVARIERLAATPPDDVDMLQELLYGLYALISVHFRKEEDIQLPVFDVQPPAVVADIFDRMGHAGHEH